jgi:hypothetical protein
MHADVVQHRHPMQCSFKTTTTTLATTAAANSTNINNNKHLNFQKNLEFLYQFVK